MERTDQKIKLKCQRALRKFNLVFWFLDGNTPGWGRRELPNYISGVPLHTPKGIHHLYLNLIPPGETTHPSNEAFRNDQEKKSYMN